jgi:hypothetical protein
VDAFKKGSRVYKRVGINFKSALSNNCLKINGRMKRIYFKPHCKRKSEKAFFDFLSSQLENSIHIEQNYKLPEEYIDRLIDINELLSSIEVSKYITDKKKRIIRECLVKLPNKIK